MNPIARIDGCAALDIGQADRSSVRCDPVAARRSAAISWRDLCQLAKLRMNGLVVATTFVGYYMSQHGLEDHRRLGFALAGTALTAAAASALNQYAERDYDALMPRTANRPLPAGRLRPTDALLFGVALAIAGIAILAIFVNLLTALLGAITIGTYLLLYTPAKRRTPLCTVIGAVPGAMPAMMGVTAADGAISLEAVALFTIVFFWQIPHFMAIAILYCRDYAAGGFVMLPVVDAELHRTARQIVLWSLALRVATLVPVFLGRTGAVYFVAAIILNAAFGCIAIACVKQRSHASARRLFLGSIIFLPLLLGIMAFDRRPMTPPSHQNFAYAIARP